MNVCTRPHIHEHARAHTHTHNTHAHLSQIPPEHQNDVPHLLGPHPLPLGANRCARVKVARFHLQPRPEPRLAETSLCFLSHTYTPTQTDKDTYTRTHVHTYIHRYIVSARASETEIWRGRLGQYHITPLFNVHKPSSNVPFSFTSNSCSLTLLPQRAP